MAALNKDQFLEEARRATERRMQAAHNIAEALERRDTAKTELAHADAAAEAAFKEAEKLGWSKTELRRLRPSDMKPARTRTTRTKRSSNETATPERTGDATDTPTTES